MIDAMQSNYQVAGMTCQHCVSHVQAALDQIEGLTVTDLSLVGALTIESAEPIDLAAIQAAVAAAGDYSVSQL